MSTNSSRSNFRVNTFISGEQINPDIAIGSLGNFIITWQSEDQDGDGEGVFARAYNASAAPLGTDFRVNTTTQGDQVDPAVAVDATNNFVVVWASDQQNAGFSGQDVYAQRFGATGAPFSTEFRVNLSIQQDQANPDVAADALGNFVVVYESDFQDNNTEGRDDSGTGIFGQRFDRNGALFGREFRINTQTQNDQTAPVVAMNSFGDFVVAWVSNGQDRSGTGIFGQRYNSSGLAVGAEFQVGTNTEGSQTNPSIAIDDSGSFVVAWQGDDQDEDGGDNDSDGDGIYAQRFSANGSPDDPFLVNSTTDGDQVEPAVASDPNGNFTIVWANEDQDGDGFGIFGQRFLQSGRRQGREFQVNRASDDDQTRPTVAVTSSADSVVAWQSEIGSSDQQDILARVTVAQQEIRGTRRNDTLRGSGQADRIVGLQGDDTLRGFNGNDALVGGTEDDTLEGGNGNDVVLGGTNDDTLDGGDGNDTLSGGLGADVFVLRQKRGDTIIRDFEDGIDKLGRSAGINPNEIRLEQQGSRTVISQNGFKLATLLGISTAQITSADFERASRSGKEIEGTNAADNLVGTGGGDEITGLQGGDTLSGRAGDDSLEGGNGSDKLFGEADDDSLSGDNGDDQLTGGEGDDFLSAGNGSDQLTGGGGVDVFFLESKTGTTTIQDFEDGIDQFLLAEGLNPRQLRFQQIGADTAINLGGQQLALVKNISASQISFTPSDFV